MFTYDGSAIRERDSAVMQYPRYQSEALVGFPFRKPRRGWLFETPDGNPALLASIKKTKWDYRRSLLAAYFRFWRRPGIEFGFRTPVFGIHVIRHWNAGKMRVSRIWIGLVPNLPLYEGMLLYRYGFNWRRK